MSGSMGEKARQIFHLSMGLGAIALVLLFGIQVAAYLSSAVLVLGLCLVHFKLRGLRLGPLERIIHRLERPGVVVGYGAMTFTAATLAILTLLPVQNQVLASLMILGFGDSASTYFGIRGKRRLPYNARKTAEGVAAFFAFSLPAFFVAGFPAVVVAAAASLAESLESRMDDNLIIGVVCVVLFRLIGG